MNNDIVPGFDEERPDGLAITLEEAVPWPARGAAGRKGCLVMRLEGSLNPSNGPCFARRLARAVDAGFTMVALELEGLENAVDIEVLLRAAQVLRQQGGGLALAGLHPRAVEVLELLGLARLFTFADSADLAVAGLAAVSPAPACPPTGGTAGTRVPRPPGPGASGRRG